MFIQLKKSTNPKKKFTAIFYDENKKKIKTTHFGSAGMSDYTIHNDLERRNRYRKRHEKDLKTNDFKRAGYLSYYLLWNKKTFKNSLEDYLKRFKLKKYIK